MLVGSQPGRSDFQGMKSLINGQSAKFLVALLTTAATSLSTYYGNTRWEPVVVSVLGALCVWLIPNAPKS